MHAILVHHMLVYQVQHRELRALNAPPYRHEHAPVSRARVYWWRNSSLSQRLLQYDAVLAVDASAGRRGVRGGRAADGVGLHRQAAAALSAGDRPPDLPDAVGAPAGLRASGMT